MSVSHSHHGEPWMVTTRGCLCLLQGLDFDRLTCGHSKEARIRSRLDAVRKCVGGENSVSECLNKYMLGRPTRVRTKSLLVKK